MATGKGDFLLLKSMGRHGGGLSLKKTTFLRLVLITFAAVVIFYVIGLTINRTGIQYVRDDLAHALETHTSYIAGQISQEFDRLNFFMLEMLSDKQLLRYALSYPILNDYQRMDYIKTLSGLEYMIKRSSTLPESVQIMLPGQNHTIITDQALFTDLDPVMWEALIGRSERNRVTVTEWDGRLWMLLPRYDQGKPLFLIAISIASENLTERMAAFGSEQADGLALLREDGSAFASCGEGPALREEYERQGGGKNILSASTPVTGTALTMTGYGRIDETMAPFVLYRTTLWLLTLISLALLGTYLLYYRVYIMRPINDIFNTMRQAGQDGRYRIQKTRGTDYDDIYVQFNDMVEHIETLAGQVYEEQYRAQKAELKQLQMQIDPHFLYNSLYLIYRIAQSEGSKSIAGLSLNLSNYYRYITKMPEQIVCLRDEIKHVTNYLEIQRVRFEPRIHIDIQPLPEEIAGERIPSLIIQPIVENAFQHGVKDRVSDGLVRLRYEVSEEEFRVIVSDNSGKMDDETVRQLWEKIKSPDDSNVSALRNLYRRLQIYEDSGRALALQCVDHGLTAVLTFRKRENPHADTADRR